MSANLVAYIPALHRGYVDFFKRYKGGSLYIISLDLVREVPRLERDIRALSAEEIKSAVSGLKIFENVVIASEDDISKIEGEIVMPDEDVSHFIAEKFFSGKKVIFEPVFLRWDRNSALFEKKSPEANRNISRGEFDKEIMEEANLLSQKSGDWWRQVGAVLIRNGKVLFSAFNHPLPNEQIHNTLGDPRSNFDYGERIDLSLFVHAEASIVAHAAKAGESLLGSSIYVTTFPCPGCARLIIEAGIRKVFYDKGYSLLDAETLFKESDVEIVKVELDS